MFSRKMVSRQTLRQAGALLLLAVAWIPAKYSGSILGYLPGFGILTLFLLSRICLSITRRSLQFETGASRAVCERGEMIHIFLKVRNRSVLSCPKIRAIFILPVFFGREAATNEMEISMYAKEEAEYPVEIRMRHIGIYEIGVGKLRIYDPLGLFFFVIKGNERFKITVLPREVLTDEIDLKERLLTESRTAARNAVSDGFDYTGVREYALGDPMKRIHWKLSAHTYGYMTKISESSRKNDLAILIDFSRIKSPQIFDCLVETALSLAEQALKQDTEYSLLFVAQDHEMVRLIPKGEDDREALVQQLPVLWRDEDDKILDGADLLEEEGTLGNKGANVILCTSNLTDRLIPCLIDILQQQRNPELFYLVPRDHDLDTESMTLLGILDEYGICFHVVEADETDETDKMDKGSVIL